MDAVAQNNIMLMGDLNLNFPGENKILESGGFDDLWLEKHSHFKGLTWDTQINRML